MTGNTISDSRGVGGKGDVTAIYLDDLAAATSVTRNRVTNVRRGVLVGGGRDNRITDNTFADVDIPVSIDARGTHNGMKMLAPDGVLQTRLKAAPYRSAPWRNRYPELLTLLEDEPSLPKRNVVQGNVLIDSGEMNIIEPAYRFGTITDNRREPGPP